jgi:hypothetical protein
MLLFDKMQVVEATEAEIAQELEEQEDEEEEEEQSGEQSADSSAHTHKKKKGILAVLRRKVFRPIKRVLISPKKLMRKCKCLKYISVFTKFAINVLCCYLLAHEHWCDRFVDSYAHTLLIAVTSSASHSCSYTSPTPYTALLLLLALSHVFTHYSKLR